MDADEKLRTEPRRAPPVRRVDKMRLACRLARTNAVASADRMRAEPGTRAEEVALLMGILANGHRFVYSVIPIETGILTAPRPVVRSEFVVFAEDLFVTLDGLSTLLRSAHPPVQKWPDLREAHRRLLQNPLSAVERYALVNVEADRMANSLNTLREQIVEWKRITKGGKTSDP
jgi:hypothetical protein